MALECVMCFDPIKGLPSGFCKTCLGGESGNQGNLCKGCADKHDDPSKYTRLMSHVYERRGGDELDALRVLQLEPTETCLSHAGELVRLFCSECMTPICLRCVPAHQGRDHNLQDIIPQILQLHGSLLEATCDTSCWLPSTLRRLPRRPVTMTVCADSSGTSVASTDTQDASFVRHLVVGSAADFRGLQTGGHWMTVRVREMSSDGGELTLETQLLESAIVVTRDDSRNTWAIAGSARVKELLGLEFPRAQVRICVYKRISSSILSLYHRFFFVFSLCRLNWPTVSCAMTLPGRCYSSKAPASAAQSQTPPKQSLPVPLRSKMRQSQGCVPPSPLAWRSSKKTQTHTWPPSTTSRRSPRARVQQ